MLVITRPAGTAVLCIPKPFGPIPSAKAKKAGNAIDPKYGCRFEEVITKRLVAAGVAEKDIVYIDDFFTYHVGVGEIHCGTNSIRTPRKDVWWWESTNV
jgi:protein-arginine deiminase